MLEDDIKLDTGLVLSVIVDTHFMHLARFGRLAHTVIFNQEYWGIVLGEIQPY